MPFIGVTTLSCMFYIHFFQELFCFDKDIHCVRERHPHVNVLLLALDLCPLILLFLQFLGHLQVRLHQAALVDIGRQVALNCRHRNTNIALSTAGACQLAGLHYWVRY